MTEIMGKETADIQEILVNFNKGIRSMNWEKSADLKCLNKLK